MILTIAFESRMCQVIALDVWFNGEWFNIFLHTKHPVSQLNSGMFNQFEKFSCLSQSPFQVLSHCRISGIPAWKNLYNLNIFFSILTPPNINHNSHFELNSSKNYRRDLTFSPSFAFLLVHQQDCSVSLSGQVTCWWLQHLYELNKFSSESRRQWNIPLPYSWWRLLKKGINNKLLEMILFPDSWIQSNWWRVRSPHLTNSHIIVWTDPWLSISTSIKCE